MFPPVTGTEPLVPDDPAEHVERGVGAHEGVPALPVDLPVDGAPLRAGTASSEAVPDGITLLADLDDPGRAAVPRQDPRVVGLSASGGVEGGAVEGDAITIDRKHLGIERAQSSASWR